MNSLALPSVASEFSRLNVPMKMVIYPQVAPATKRDVELGHQGSIVSANELVALVRIKTFEQTCKISQQMDTGELEIYKDLLETASKLSNRFRVNGWQQDAERVYKQVLQGFKKIGDLKSELETRLDLAILYAYKKSTCVEAERIYKSLLKQHEKRSDPESMQEIYFNLAMLYADKKSTRGKAERIYKSLLKEHEKRSDTGSMLETSRCLANLYADKKSTRGKAERIYKSLLKEHEKRSDTGSMLETSRCLANLDVYDESTRKEAERIHTVLLKMHKKAANVEVLNLYRHLAQLYVKQNKLEEAELMFTRANLVKSTAK
jgi:tRNA threonylcarbamoyladenosine modification (KEOPS) complex  Pcc1 subunit